MKRTLRKLGLWIFVVVTILTMVLLTALPAFGL